MRKRRLNRMTQGLAGMTGLTIVGAILILAHAGNRQPKTAAPHYLTDSASADTQVEALKTVTANLLVLEKKNRALSQQLKTLQQQHHQELEKFQHTLQTQVAQLRHEINDHISTHKTNNSISSITTQQKKSSKDFIWVEDQAISTTRSNDSEATKEKNSAIPTTANTSTTWLPKTQTLLPVKPPITTKKTIQLVYTIPLNATLTGATLMTPLVGRIPIDGHITEPYWFKLVLSGKNLTANGYPLPGIQGAVMSGIASGDLLGHCARGDIKSITFIFNDGTISSTEAKTSQSLGYLSSENGDPCLAGTLHTNAALFLSVQMGLASAEGYANALTRSQYLSSVTDQDITLSSLIGNANKAALGKGSSAASQVAQAWWNQRVKNSFDYIYVSNRDPKTGKARNVVVNITQAIEINKDPNGRRVDENSLTQPSESDLD